jgi:hypothetical protein
MQPSRVVTVITTHREWSHSLCVDDHLAYDWMVIVNPHPLTRIHPKDATGATNRLNGIPRLTDNDIHVAIFYREDNLDNREYGANFGVVILLVVNLVAFVTLFFHVANM